MGVFWRRCLASRLENKNFPRTNEAKDLALTCSRPIKMSAVVYPSPTGDPEGGAQDAHRFSMRQDASSKNPGFAADGRFELDLNVFFGDFLDSHLRCSPFGPASPFAPHAAQCAKESYPRKARKHCCCLPL